MRAEHEKAAAQFCFTHSKITGAKTCDLEIPNRSTLQGQRKSRTGFVFYGYIDARYIARPRRTRSVKSDFSFQLSRGPCPMRIIEPQKCRDRHFQPRRN